MSSFGLSVKVTRTQLGLADLELNDNLNYRMAGGELFQANVSWERQTTKSPYVEGEFTTNRRRNNVQETMAFDVFPGNSAGISGQSKFALEANLQQIIAAMTQDSFRMDVVVSKSTQWQQEWHWNCEASDYSVQMTNARFVARQGIVTFMVIRNPVPSDLTWSSW
jgi:hypothetical protein